ncbi:MAG: noncanonical pyrimidine nucleotidase, YjjG family [Chitinophagaceae bacterium]|nr:MAG: noncanonical pyrimidine nucleotidase, YjjG family [Chitinophagaceae bacterium]
MKYRHLFFDLDHTLWDFEANARVTLETLYEDLHLRERGVDDFELFYRNYLAHNERLWERYRKGFIKQEDLRIKRMFLSLLDFRIADDALTREMSGLFIDLLPTRTILFPHTKEILQYLAGKNYQLHLITNGFEKVQHSKLKNSGLAGFFGEVITSEGSNSLKPSREIFEYAFRKTNASLDSSIMIGDTQEVDIQGAINAGIDQVFVNHTGAASTVPATYTVTHLRELEGIF